jgi:ubiquinone/menaquinone biosynthesis C-methylase UbiE
MDDKPRDSNHREEPHGIGKTELRLMNSRGRELLLKHWDFPLFASALRRHGISLAGTSILDAGCGSGYGLTLIVERFHPATLTAFDLVPSQVEIARSRATPAHVFVGDITALDLPDRSFDAVFVCGVLHHCREWRTGLAEVARVLKAGGVLLLEEPDVAHLSFERMLAGHSPALDAGFSLDALMGEMGRNGLAVREHRPLYFGLFGSFLCVKGINAADGAYYTARHLLRSSTDSELVAGQHAPA